MPCCLIYARSAPSRHARTGRPTAAHHAACRTYIDARGWRIAGAYADNGFPGSALLRPGLAALLTHAQGGGVDVVVVHHADQLASTPELLYALAGRLHRCGVAIYSVAHPDAITVADLVATLGRRRPLPVAGRPRGQF